MSIHEIVHGRMDPLADILSQEFVLEYLAMPDLSSLLLTSKQCKEKLDGTDCVRVLILFHLETEYRTLENITLENFCRAYDLQTGYARALRHHDPFLVVRNAIRHDNTNTVECWLKDVHTETFKLTLNCENLFKMAIKYNSAKIVELMISRGYIIPDRSYLKNATILRHGDTIYELARTMAADGNGDVPTLYPAAAKYCTDTQVLDLWDMGKITYSQMFLSCVIVAGRPGLLDALLRRWMPDELTYRGLFDVSMRREKIDALVVLSRHVRIDHHKAIQFAVCINSINVLDFFLNSKEDVKYALEYAERYNTTMKDHLRDLSITFPSF